MIFYSLSLSFCIIMMSNISSAVLKLWRYSSFPLRNSQSDNNGRQLWTLGASICYVIFCTYFLILNINNVTHMFLGNLEATSLSLRDPSIALNQFINLSVWNLVIITGCLLYFCLHKSALLSSKVLYFLVHSVHIDIGIIINIHEFSGEFHLGGILQQSQIQLWSIA